MNNFEENQQEIMNGVLQLLQENPNITRDHKSVANKIMQDDNKYRDALIDMNVDPWDIPDGETRPDDDLYDKMIETFYNKARNYNEDNSRVVNSDTIDEYLANNKREDVDPLLYLMLLKAQKAGYGKHPVGGDEIYEGFYPLSEEEIEDPLQAMEFDMYER